METFVKPTSLRPGPTTGYEHIILINNEIKLLLILYSVMVDFCGSVGKSTAAKFAFFRTLWQILFFSSKDLGSQFFFNQSGFQKVTKTSFFPFHFLIVVLKLPLCFKLRTILEAVQSVLTATTASRYLTLNRVMSTFSFTCVPIYAVNVIYTTRYCCYFQLCLPVGVLFPCT